MKSKNKSIKIPDKETPISKEIYNAWMEQFANTIQDTIVSEIKRRKRATKKKI